MKEAAWDIVKIVWFYALGFVGGYFIGKTSVLREWTAELVRERQWVENFTKTPTDFFALVEAKLRAKRGEKPN